MTPLQTAVVVPVPEAELVVAEWREKFDPVTARGMPAHITLLFPFIPSDRLGMDHVSVLRELIESQPAFDFTLERVERFPDGLLYLAPSHDDWFSAMSHAIGDAFGTPPYGGAYDPLIPHLTVVVDGDADSAEAAIAPTLPIACRATEAWLMREHHDGSWRTLARFHLRSG